MSVTKSESKRTGALHDAADRILALLEEKRKASSGKAWHVPPPPAEIDPGPVGGSAGSTHDEEYRRPAGRARRAAALLA